MNSRLLWKIVVINLFVLSVAIAVVGGAIHVSAADYFATLVKDYQIAPEKAHQMFLEAVRRYLAGAGLVACLLAIALSFFMTRRVLRPLTQMTRSAALVAAGDYAVTVERLSNDEVGELAEAFNRMTQSLLRVELLRKEMVANVAHELRTPLTNMRGYLEGLMDGVVSPSTETFSSLHEETLRLVKLVEDLLQLARADAARTNLQRDNIRLDEIVSQVVELFRLKFEAKEIRLEVGSQSGTALTADRDKVRQILTNLLENAWRYTPAKGWVRVSTEESAGSVKVAVSNSSDGIPASDAPYIFERLYRGEKSRSREYGGAGIGLAIVKELVEAHGGETGSDCKEAETTIWLRLPR